MNSFSKTTCWSCPLLPLDSAGDDWDTFPVCRVLTPADYKIDGKSRAETTLDPSGRKSGLSLSLPSPVWCEQEAKCEGVLVVKEELVSSPLSIRISSASSGILLFSKRIKLTLKTRQFFHFHFFQMGSSTRITQPHSEDESLEVSAPQPDVLGHVNAKF